MNPDEFPVLIPNVEDLDVPGNPFVRKDQPGDRKKSFRLGKEQMYFELGLVIIGIHHLRFSGNFSRINLYSLKTNN